LPIYLLHREKKQPGQNYKRKRPNWFLNEYDLNRS
jgi:hypothetical protein